MKENLIMDVSGLGFVMLGIGLFFTLVSYAFIVMVEAIILWKMKWDTFQKSFAISLWVNLISGIAGVILSTLIGFSTVEILFQYKTLPFLVVGFVLSVAIEGGLLFFLKPSNWQLAIDAAFLINLASYLWNGVIFLIFL